MSAQKIGILWFLCLASGVSFGQDVTEYSRSLCKIITENNQFTDHLTPADLVNLPVGLSTQTESGPIIIAIDSAFSNERGWFFNAYTTISIPGISREMTFAAKNIGFGPGGLLSTTQVRMTLASGRTIQISDKISLELSGDGSNYVEFTCDGFYALNMKGNFVFSEDMIRPDLQLDNGSNVTASFEINTHDLNNILTGVNITPFRIAGFDDLSFKVINAFADFSDITNPPNCLLPLEYQSIFGADVQLWRGFYIQDASITLAGFSHKDEPPSFTVRNLILDDFGVSGTIAGNHLLSLQNDGVGNWPLSIDNFFARFHLNRLTAGSLEGEVIIPLLGKEPIGYSALMEQLNGEVSYKFLLTINEKEFRTPLSATVVLNKGSSISLEKRNDKLIPSALLHGDLMVEGTLFNTSRIHFENLGLISEEPYITSGLFSSGDDDTNRMAGFPVRIDSVVIRAFQGQASLGFAVACNLMDTSDKGFSADTFVQILANLETDGPTNDESLVEKPRHEWKFDKIVVNDIRLESKSTAFYLKGIVSIFENDPVFGKGFRGGLEFKVSKIMSTPIKVNAYFGSLEEYRYWHLDAYAPTANIPVVPPVLSINGLIGGASYHMIRRETFTPDFAALNNEKLHEPQQELIYIPDKGTGTSFLAGVTLIGGQEKVLNGDVTLEVTFNSNGGIRYAQFKGSAFFFTAIKNRGRVKGYEVPDAPVHASINLLYDDDNQVFHANLKTYMNLAGVIRGTGPGGLVGEAVIHVDPDDWYFYIGRPSQMFGIDVARLAVAQAYFMIGTQVEPIPAPPREVMEIFNEIDPGLMRDENALGRGRGFATGAHFRVGFDTGDKLRPFYAMLMIGAGADIMLRDFGEAYCEGRSGRIGIDGWYASGQAYVFLIGKVGIRVRRTNYDFLSLGAAAMLQAKLPNPTWMKGQIGGRYSILGGLVKGRFKIKLVVGEECELVIPGGDIETIEVIADLKPDDAATDVSVFAAPQVSFNTAIEKSFTMMNLKDEVHSYRIRLAEFSLTDNNNMQIPAVIKWNEAQDVAVLNTKETLPPRSMIHLKASVYWEKKTGNGSWEAMKENGQVIYEIKEVTFATGSAPDYIPHENVDFSYPVAQQYNFHAREYPTGYLQLKRGQSYLFESQPGEPDWRFNVRFETGQGSRIETSLYYDKEMGTIFYEIPSSLISGQVYRLSFIKSSAGSSIDQNVQRNSVTVLSDSDQEVTVASSSLDGSIVQELEKSIYSSAFRTSMFPTFQEKWTSIGQLHPYFNIANGDVVVIGAIGMITERFDIKDLNSESPLLQAEGLPNSWMNSFVIPLIYYDYPISPQLTISWRDTKNIGIIPYRGVTITTANDNCELTDSNITSGIASPRGGPVHINYFIPYYTYWDFIELRNKAAAAYLNNWSSAPDEVKRFLSASAFSHLMPGSYPVQIRYVLPGIDRTTFQTQIQIQYQP